MERLARVEGGGLVFAIGGWDDGEARFTFEAGEIAYEMLKDRPSLRLAPISPRAA